MSHKKYQPGLCQVNINQVSEMSQENLNENDINTNWNHII
jgi:hypothetical protein